MKSEADVRDEEGRIKVFIEEERVEDGDGEEQGLGNKRDSVVCFSFQHAPRGERLLRSRIPSFDGSLEKC